MKLRFLVDQIKDMAFEELIFRRVRLRSELLLLILDVHSEIGKQMLSSFVHEAIQSPQLLCRVHLLHFVDHPKVMTSVNLCIGAPWLDLV